MLKKLIKQAFRLPLTVTQRVDMKTFEQLATWRLQRQSLGTQTTIGFVPTMGNLHQGHLSLFEKSRHENDLTVGSIFVNPTQFNQQEDFLNYPNTISKDLQYLKELGVDFCLMPKPAEIYADNYRFQITENDISLNMEGKQRPGHFTGVLTIVMKLLQIVKPHKTYLGQKDYQQAQLIQNMVDAFFMDIEVITCKTIREKSGLACSSRNNRLNTDERKLANQFAQIFHGSADILAMKKAMLALGIEVEYIEEHDNHRFVAVKIGNIRLIDNYRLTDEKP